MNEETIQSMKIAGEWAKPLPLDCDRDALFDCPKCGGEMLVKQEKKYGHLSCKCLDNGCVAWIT